MLDQVLKTIRDADSEIAVWMDKELIRQRGNLELIASENIISEAVMAAMGNHLSNKYAEGYPGKRYYGGCEYVDEVEKIAIARANELFGSNYANVQPHSGAQANMAVYHALLNPGDKVMGMNLAHGGHLTHGSAVNFSGKLYNFVQYNVADNSGYIDYDQVLAVAQAEKPKMIVAGASAYSRKIEFDKFADIAKKVGAYLFVDMAHIAGLVAAGLHQSPIDYADVVSTTTHKTLRGPRGGMILAKDADFGKQFDKAVFPGIQGGPLMHVIAAKAVSFKEALTPEFKAYQRQIVLNAKVLADELVANGFNLVSGGTDNHLMLVDLRSKGITGKELENRLDTVRITVNKNSVPNDTASPFITSGIRIGTPTVTSRGMKESEMKEVARLIAMTADDFENSKSEITSAVGAMCDKFPIY